MNTQRLPRAAGAIGAARSRSYAQLSHEQEQLVQLLRETGGLTALQLAERTGRHLRAVRTALDKLMTRRHVVRELMPTTGQGRRQHLYRVRAEPVRPAAPPVASDDAVVVSLDAERKAARERRERRLDDALAYIRGNP